MGGGPCEVGVAAVCGAGGSTRAVAGLRGTEGAAAEVWGAAVLSQTRLPTLFSGCGPILPVLYLPHENCVTCPGIADLLWQPPFGPTPI